MGPPGHASAGLRSGRTKRSDAAQKLDKKPQADERQRRNPRPEPENEKRDESQNFRARKQNDVGSQNPGDRAARAESRDPRAPGEKRLGDA